MNRKIFLCVLVVNFISGCCSPILYTPSADPSEPLLNVRIPKTDYTLEGLAGAQWNFFTKMNGKDMLQEMLTIDRCGARFTLYLYSSNEGATSGFVLTAGRYQKDRIFRLKETENYSYIVSYIERPRSDMGGLCLPMDFYRQTAVFKRDNLKIYIEVVDRQLTSDMLSEPIKCMADVLQSYFNKSITKGAATNELVVPAAETAN